MTNQDSNNTLYFIVGGLVVLALVFGLVFWNKNGINPSALEPAAGQTQMDQTRIDLDKDGGTITHTTTDGE